ncbi:DUF192 domain-containing protein [Natronorubrum halophilum]|uniref:DUF192 domain-containing protein n=1 Tax=Natronorubrum halophilum TaxID=1702106 RepID=UPI0010C18E20|nr:DUF192 domain-containing protein [Natronorubrum halophilum]
MTPLRSSIVDRRTVLAGLAVSLSSLGLAGCTDDTDGNEQTEESNSSDDDSSPGDSNSSDDDSSTEIHADYESTDVRVTNPDGDELGEVTAAIADTPERQQLGLSDTEELPEDRGMLFVYETVEDREFIMPDMSFGIDIIFADDEGVITGIANAPEPGPDEDGSEQTYPGRGQYVLEVVYEWTDERDVEEGDILEFDL